MNLIVLVLSLLLQQYPYTISLTTSEAVRGQVIVATVSAPSNANPTISAPGLVVSAPRYIGGDTWKATITVPKNAAQSKTPRTVVLLVNGKRVSSVPLRVGGTNRLYMPILRRV